MAGKAGRPPKQPVAKRIEDALGAAQEEIDKKMPKDVQDKLVPPDASPEIVEVKAPRISKDAQDDYEFARSNLHNLLLKGNEILEGITDLAKEGDHPRTYEVAGGVLKTLLDGTRELMTLQKDIRDVEKKSTGDKVESDAPAPVTIKSAENVNQTIVLETTTMDMLDILERAKKSKEQEKEQGE